MTIYECCILCPVTTHNVCLNGRTAILGLVIFMKGWLVMSVAVLLHDVTFVRAFFSHSRLLPPVLRDEV